MRYIPAFLWACLIFLLSSQQRLPGWISVFSGTDKLVHAAAYAVLCLWLLFGARGPRNRSMWWCACACSLYGITDEYHQGFVPGRTQDVWDWVADTTGAVLCVLLWQRFGPRLLEFYRHQSMRLKPRA